MEEEREVVVKLIAAQLSYYKQDEMAKLLASKFNLLTAPPASNKLAEMLNGSGEAISATYDAEADEYPIVNLLVEPSQAKPSPAPDFKTWFTSLFFPNIILSPAQRGMSHGCLLPRWKISSHRIARLFDQNSGRFQDKRVLSPAERC